MTAMRDSRRPGGVPDQLETEQIAAAVAAAVVTFDGLPWTTMAASGSCGTDSCTLELAGTRPDSLGDDVWIFDVRPADGTVAVTIGRAARRCRTSCCRHSTSWPGRSSRLRAWRASCSRAPGGSPRRTAEQFALSYRGDGEEGSCGLDVTLDAVTPGIVGDVSQTC